MFSFSLIGTVCVPVCVCIPVCGLKSYNSCKIVCNLFYKSKVRLRSYKRDWGCSSVDRVPTLHHEFDPSTALTEHVFFAYNLSTLEV